MNNHISSELIAVFWGLVSAALTIIALIQRHRFNEFRKKVFIEQGTFKKPTLDLSFFGRNDISTFIIAVPLEENAIWEVSLPIKIANVGEKTAENIEVSYRINKELCYGGAAELRIEAGFKNTKVVHFHENGPFISMITSISDIHPGQSFVFPHPFSIRSDTIFPHDIKATTKDGVDVIAKTWISLGYPFDCVIAQKDYKPVGKRLTLQVIDTGKETIENFLNRYNKALSESHKEPISKMNFIQRIRNFFQGEHSTHIVGLIVVDPSIKKTEQVIKAGGKNIIIHRTTQKALTLYPGIKLSDGYIFPALSQKNK
jgi:hypothetical protein